MWLSFYIDDVITKDEAAKMVNRKKQIYLQI